MRKTTFCLFVLVSLLGVLLSACTPSATSVETASNATAVATATTLPTTTSLPPTATATATITSTATSTPSATPTSTHTPSATPTATFTATNTATPLPTATNTPLPPTATPILFTATPLPTATSSLPGNPLPLTGGSYNGCPLLAPGQYTTEPYGCDSCIRMDLANWAMASTVAPGASLQQVVGAYEQDSSVYLSFASGESINLSAMNYRYIVVIVSLSRAIETWEDSLDTQNVSPEEFLSVLGPGTTIGYINNPASNLTAVRVAPICGE